jgi:hypothetical protein
LRLLRSRNGASLALEALNKVDSSKNIERINISANEDSAAIDTHGGGADADDDTKRQLRHMMESVDA